jgi:hypothetical protein
MVMNGYAHYYESYPITLEEDFEAAEQDAQSQGLGLWETCETPVDDGSGLSISYVFYDGEVAQVESDEYVEITNGGDATVNLEGYYIEGSSGDEKYTFSDYELASGESVQVTTNGAAPTFGNNSAIWSNAGETVYLYASDGTLIDSYSY